MSNELINLPNIQEVKEFLNAARDDINEAVKEDSELEQHHLLISEIISYLQEQIDSKKNLDKLATRERIAFAAHLCLLQDLLEEIFLEDVFEDTDEEEDFDLDDSDESYIDFDEDEDSEEDMNNSKNKKSKSKK